MTDKIWHVELVATDKHEAAQWYNKMFGWEVEHFEEMDYIQVRSGSADPTLAFAAVNPEQGMPAGGALVYVDVADIDATIARAKEVGGAIIMDKMDIPNVGQMTIVGDPYGNRFAAMQRAFAVPSTNNARAMMLAEQIKSAGKTLHGTMEGVTDEIAHHQPGGKANSIAANIAHLITSIDGVVNGMLKGGQPLGMSMESGLSAPPPMGENMFKWHDWGTQLKVDLPKLREYAEAVFGSVSDYLGGLSDSDLDQAMQTPAGERTVFQMLNGAVLNNITMHTGEIASLKGQHGLKGYPF